MRLAIVVAAAAVGLASTAHAASVELREVAARVVVIPEARRDVQVSVIGGARGLPVKVSMKGDRTIITGGLDRRIQGCRGEGDQVRVRIRGLEEVAWRDLPQIVIRTPRDVKLEAAGAVWGSVGRSASLSLANAGCGDWTLANVEGALYLAQVGDGDTRAGSAGEAKVRVAGSGDVALAQVRQGLRVDIAGSGDVSVARISGPLNVDIAGSGDVTVGAGRADAMTASLAGSGDVAFGGVAQSLKVRIAGSGDVRVRQVRGQVSRAVLGSGGVFIGGAKQPAGPFQARIPLDRDDSNR